MERGDIQCDTHGTSFQAYICEHPFENPKQSWFSGPSTDENPWPDAWCSLCHEAYLRDGGWNDANSVDLRAKLICHRCYEIKSGDAERVIV